MKFQIGDRVKVWDVDQNTGDVVYDKGTVVAVHGNDVLQLQTDYWNKVYQYYHIKQCKKLKPKKEKELWIRGDISSFNYLIKDCMPGDQAGPFIMPSYDSIPYSLRDLPWTKLVPEKKK
jgi:hypothetical protein